MDPNLYDEFGNYVGPVLELDVANDYGNLHVPHDDAMDLDPVFDSNHAIHCEDGAEDDLINSSALVTVLHEDRVYYPSASTVYGAGVETLVQDEDAQPLSVPIIAPAARPGERFPDSAASRISHLRGEYETSYSSEYLLSSSRVSTLVRNVAVVGHLHHGKTAFFDLLVEHTHPVVRWDLERSVRFLDTHSLSRIRGLSLKTMPISLMLSGLPQPASRARPHVFHLMDTPGHVDFVDEVVCALRLCDGAVLLVDAVEGLMSNSERILRRIVLNRIPLCVVINKIDRLALELKLPPRDAHLKLACIIEEINTCITSLIPNASEHEKWRISPDRNNVCFASADFGFCFSLASFAGLYSELHGLDISIRAFARRLWGDMYFETKTGKFMQRSPAPAFPVTFVHFIMEPLYKIFSVTIGESADHISEVFAEQFGVSFKKAELAMDSAPFMRLAFSRVFGAPHCFADMLIEHIPSPVENANEWVSRWYTGPLNSKIAKKMISAISEVNEPFVNRSASNLNSNCYNDESDSAEAPLVIHVSKLYPEEESDATNFLAFGRVISGTVRQGQKVRVLGEGYTVDDDEDSMLATITSLGFYQSRYIVPADFITAGNLVVIGGVSRALVKTGTLVDEKTASMYSNELAIFLPLRHLSQSIVKVAIEPVQPSELPKMLDALRKINKTYPLSVTKVEESGEHILLGTGELYLDCILHDLRRVFSEIQIKVSDPSARFCETVADSSCISCFAESPNQKNWLSMVSDPLDARLTKMIEECVLSLQNDKEHKSTAKRLQEEFNWDVLAAHSLWAFGPDSKSGPNVLLDDTLTEKGSPAARRLHEARSALRQGFQWATREGPLCDEPVRGVRVRIVGARLADAPVHRGGGQLIPTARRLVHASMLVASPRLMEPVFSVEIQAPGECVAAIYDVLARRRGHVVKEAPRPGTPLSILRAHLPVMDSFGFETDLRTHTLGQAFCQQLFDHYQLAPGDPLDRTIDLRPLEPAVPGHIARDFMLKTRRRKGLSEEVSLGKYLDDPVLINLARDAMGSSIVNIL